MSSLIANFIPLDLFPPGMSSHRICHPTGHVIPPRVSRIKYADLFLLKSAVHIHECAFSVTGIMAVLKKLLSFGLQLQE